MRKLALIGILVAVGAFATSAALTSAPATVIVGDGCTVVDANGAFYFDADCRIQIVTNGNNFMVNAHGELPDGAALPAKALRRSITDLGFAGCFVLGDRGETVLTPSGNFNVSCHPAK